MVKPQLLPFPVLNCSHTNLAFLIHITYILISGLLCSLRKHLVWCTACNHTLTTVAQSIEHSKYSVTAC